MVLPTWKMGFALGQRRLCIAQRIPFTAIHCGSRIPRTSCSFDRVRSRDRTQGPARPYRASSIERWLHRLQQHPRAEPVTGHTAPQSSARQAPTRWKLRNRHSEPRAHLHHSEVESAARFVAIDTIRVNANAGAARGEILTKRRKDAKEAAEICDLFTGSRRCRDACRSIHQLSEPLVGRPDCLPFGGLWSRL